jgi:hypothetical protein
MRRPHPGGHRLLPLSAEAWAAAGMSAVGFVEGMLLELLLHHQAHPCYFCSRKIANNTKICRFHEIMIHETCYLREMR